jgi:hypothetical protein
MGKIQILVLILIICLVIIIVLQADQQAQDVIKSVAASGGAGARQKYNIELPPPPVIQPKPTIVIDGLNYIHSYLKHEPITNENMLVSYPNIINIWKCINVAAKEYEARKNNVIFVLKNQDGYKLSEHEKKLYETLAKRLKIAIHIAYDPNIQPKDAEHYMSGRDDKYINELSQNGSVEVISEDKYRDAIDFDKIPKFEVIKF